MVSAADTTIQALFETRAAASPQRPAFVSVRGRISFYDLNSQANRLAHYLRSTGIGPEDVVGVCIGTGLELPVALLGIVKAGAAFVGLDPAHPAARLAAIARDAGCRAVVFRRRGDAFDACPAPAVGLDGLPADAPAGDANPPCRARPDNLFQVVYTSGSTGTPKGVVLDQRSFVRKLDWIRQWCPVNEDDVLLMYRSIGLAAGAWDCFMGPLTGVATVMVPGDALNDARRLWTVLCDNAVSHLFASPRLVQAVLDQAESGADAKPRLRLATSSGERLPERTVRRWLAAFPHVPLLDVYGASEYTSAIVLDASRALRCGSKPTHGMPTRGTRAYVLNPDLSQAPIGRSGDICLAGPHLARGYLNAPGATAGHFVPCPFEPGARMYRTGDLGRRHADGGIEVIGRNDDVVNIRGYRVGLAEVENALADHAGVRECAVVALGDPPRLAAYFVAGEAASEEELRECLRKRLPAHMMPSAFIERACLPRTHAGKLDRRALSADGRVAQASAADLPATPTEHRVAAIWSDVLETGGVGVNAGFLALGGDSVHAMRILARINQAFGLDLSLSDLMNLPTIRRQAAFLDRISPA